jgi:O-antigen ligase
MNLVLIYFMLFAFWLEKVANFSMGLPKGFSLMNLSIYLLLLAWARKLLVQRKLFDSNNVNGALTLFIFIMLISIVIKMLINEIPNISLKREIIYFKNHINPYILFFAVFNIISDVKTCRRVLLGLLIFLAATLSTVILQQFGFAHISSVQTHAEGSRASGWGNANAYASYLVLFIPLVLSYLLFRKNSLVKKILYGGLFLMAFIGLLITGSRGGILSLIFSMGIYVLLLKQKIKLPFSRIIIMLTLIFVLGTSALLFTPPEVTDMVVGRFVRLGEVAEEGVDYAPATGGRFILWTSGLKLYLERPLFGHGIGTINYLMGKRFGIDTIAHNQFINYLIQYGIFGCVVYIFIHWKIFQHVLRKLNETDDSWSKYLYLSYIAGLSGWVFSMLGVQLFLQTPTFWLYTAVIYKYSQLYKLRKENNTSSPSSYSDIYSSQSN